MNYLNTKNNLRPVEVSIGNEVIKGHFHMFTVHQTEFSSITYALVELDNGQLKNIEPEFVKFLDRKIDTFPSHAFDKD